MTLNKKGTPEKIDQVVTGDQEFDQLKSKIAEANNLKRCKSCGQLIAKFDVDNKIINIQRKNLDMIAETSNTLIKCPNCSTINSL